MGAVVLAQRQSHSLHAFTCKGPAACVMMASCLPARRNGFPGAVRVLDAVVAKMAAMPLGSEIDVNNVTLRLSLDITGALHMP